MELKVSRKYTLENLNELQFKMIYQAIRDKDTTGGCTLEDFNARNDILVNMSGEYEQLFNSTVELKPKS